MATLNATLVPVTMSQHGIPIPNARIVDSEKVTTSGTTAPATITAPAFANGRQLAWAMTMSGGAGWVKFGVGTQTAVSGTGHYLPDGVKEYFLAAPNETYAVIDA